MTAVYARLQVHGLRLRGAVVSHWRRILVGAFGGWLVSTFLGAVALAWLELRGVVGSQETAALLGAAVVWSGTALGAMVSYAVRPRPDAQPVRYGWTPESSEQRPPSTRSTRP